MIFTPTDKPAWTALPRWACSVKLRTRHIRRGLFVVM